MSVSISSDDAPAAVGLANAPLPPRVRRILESLLRLVSSELEPRLESALTEFEQRLFRLADQARTPAMQGEYMQALRSLRLGKADVLPRFLLEIESCLANLGSGSDVAEHPDADQPPSRLALVDEHEIDSELVLRDIAQRGEGRASLPLHLLGQRFGVLAALPAFDAERIPLGPRALCEALRAASQPLELEEESLELLLRTFDRFVLGDFAAFAELLNDTLAREGVLPALTHVPLRVRPGGVAEPDTHPHAQPAHTAATGTQRPAGRFAGRADNISFGFLQELLRARDPEPHLGTPISPTDERPLATAELVAALGSLRPAWTPAGPQTPGIGALKQELLEQARLRFGKQAALSSADSDTFDLLDMLYERIERSVHAETLAALLLKRLQVPLLQAALRDHSFFTSEQHPAREMLNTVAESGARWLDPDDIDPAFAEALKRSVDHVVRRAHEDTDAFATGNRTLQHEAEQQAKRSAIAERRHVEAARGREKLVIAKREAAQAIESLLGEREVPKFVRALLDQAWMDVLTLGYLRHGGESSQWQELLATTNRIVAACSGQAEYDPVLATQIQEALVQVGYHDEEAAATARRLAASQEADFGPSQKELVASLKSRTRLGEQPAEAAHKPKRPLPPRTPEEQAHYDRIRVLPYGTWFEFITNQQGDVVRRRLSWYSSITDNALFVNARGQRVGEQTLDSVARMMGRGQAHVVPVERGGMVDRAWQATLGALKALAGFGDEPNAARGRA